MPTSVDGTADRDCPYNPAHPRTVTEARVRGTVLGRPFEETVALSHPLAVHSQVILDCPDRTLVRGDDRRE